MSENPQDEALLHQIDQLITEYHPSTNPLLNDLVELRPIARPSFQQGLEDMLVALQSSEMKGTNTPMLHLNEKRKNSSSRPSWAGFGVAAVFGMIFGGFMALAAIGRIPITSSANECLPLSDWKNAYIVQQGDTLSTIANDYGVSVQTLSEANCLDNPNLVQYGTVLRVPLSAGELTIPAMPTPIPLLPSPLPLDMLPTVPPIPSVPNVPNAMQDAQEAAATAQHIAATAQNIAATAQALQEQANCTTTPCTTVISSIQLPAGTVTVSLPLNLLNNTADLLPLPQTSVDITSNILMFVDENGTTQLQTDAQASAENIQYAQVVIEGVYIFIYNPGTNTLVVAVQPQDAVLLEWLVQMRLPLHIIMADSQEWVELAIPAELVDTAGRLTLNEPLSIMATGSKVIDGIVSRRAELVLMPLADDNPTQVVRYVVRLPQHEADYLQELILTGTTRFILEPFATFTLPAVAIAEQGEDVVNGTTIRIQTADPTITLAIAGDAVVLNVRQAGGLEIELPTYEADYLGDLVTQGMQFVIEKR